MSVDFFIVFLSLYTYLANKCLEFEVPKVSKVLIFAV